MKKDVFTIPVLLDAGAFRRFAIFDALTHQRRWQLPALFALILAGSAAVCFAMHSRANGAILLGTVLLVIAFGLPAAYFYTFFFSIRQQTAKLGLSRLRHVYTVTLTDEPDGILFCLPGEASPNQRFSWEHVQAAYRLGDAIYLYAAPGRALLFPDSLKDISQDALWSCLQERLPAIKLHDHRKG